MVSCCSRQHDENNRDEHVTTESDVKSVVPTLPADKQKVERQYTYDIVI